MCTTCKESFRLTSLNAFEHYTAAAITQVSKTYLYSLIIFLSSGDNKMYKNKKILAIHSKGPVFEWRRIYSNFYRGGFDPSVDEELENTLFTEHFTHRLSSCDGCQPSQYSGLI